MDYSTKRTIGYESDRFLYKIRVEIKKYRYLCDTMAKSTVKILREFYRQQGKEQETVLNPDEDTQELVKILSVENPVVRLAKRRKLSFMTTEEDRIVVVHPDNTREDVGQVKLKDIPVRERTIVFELWGRSGCEFLRVRMDLGNPLFLMW